MSFRIACAVTLLATFAAAPACKSPQPANEAADASTSGPWKVTAGEAHDTTYVEFADQSLRALRADVRAAAIALLNRAASEPATAAGIITASEAIYKAAARDGGAPLPPEESPDIALRNGEMAVFSGMVSKACRDALKGPDADAELARILGVVTSIRLVPRAGAAAAKRTDDADREALLREARTVLGDDHFTTILHGVGAGRPR